MLINPIECQKCETRFCRDCFSDYDTARRGTCPMKCKEGGRNILMSEMSEENLMELKNWDFICSNAECGKKFKYEDALKHL